MENTESMDEIKIIKSAKDKNSSKIIIHLTTSFKQLKLTEKARDVEKLQDLILNKSRCKQIVNGSRIVDKNKLFT